ncbi:MAG TPA: hypothetical protein VGJ09_16930 [Bryobacteraceae bacterium]
MLLATVVFSAVLANAQATFLAFQQQDSTIVGIAAGQTARVNVLYPSIPAPFLQAQCSVTLNIVDDQGKILKTQDFQISGGKSVSLSLNADTDLTGNHQAQIHAQTHTPASSPGGGFCTVIPSLDIVDNVSGKTVLHVEAQVTYPLTLRTLARAPLAF